ncbi:MAG: polysulfide reductase NrfD [Proteobacteria bacterium]|nr:polysulfide reductase NrfD [Pseudomonadota bacterium]
MGRNTGFSEIATDTGGYWPLIGGLGIFVAVGLGAAYTMESSGHVITGMNNRIVWGMPHVFAVFLILAAAGALTASTAASVFGRTIYKPLSRYSGVVAISLLLGGLSALMLDLGRAGALIGALRVELIETVLQGRFADAALEGFLGPGAIGPEIVRVITG